MKINFASGKRRPSPLKVPLGRFKAKPSSSPRTAASPTAAPFNSTSFLIRQKSPHRDEEDDSPVALEQYGSNMIARNRPQAQQHRNMLSPADDSALVNLQLQLQRLHLVTEMHRAEAAAQILLRQSSADLDDERHRDQALQHRRIRSVTDDNFDLLFQSNANCELHNYR